jgi:hypothetical protein
MLKKTRNNPYATFSSDPVMLSAGKTSVIFLGTGRGTLDSLERKPVFQRSYRAERF